MADNHSSNADIEFLLSSFDEKLELLKEDEEHEDITPEAREYLRSFLKHTS